MTRINIISENPLACRLRGPPTQPGESCGRLSRTLAADPPTQPAASWGRAPGATGAAADSSGRPSGRSEREPSSRVTFYPNAKAGAYRMPEVDGAPIDPKPALSYEGPHMNSIGDSVVRASYLDYVIDYDFDQDRAIRQR